MKQTVLFFFSLLFVPALFAQSYQWSWISGDSSSSQRSIYGIKGIAASANKPGAGFQGVSWSDTAGNLWMFGGKRSYQFGEINELWKYVPSYGQWTWVSGDSTPSRPGVYGTKGIAASGNKPGARFGAVTWTDASGNLWLFGGAHTPSTYLVYFNDLWRYTPSTSEWTWMGGDSIVGQKGIYGTKGVAASSNKPGARYGAVSWTDASNNFWLFGGNGYTTSIVQTYNDLWKYVLSTGQWTWISGDSSSSQPGSYGIQGLAALTNKPGSRQDAVSWTDASGNFWVFGGDSHKNSSSALFNDLWKYTPSSGLWTWMSGDSSIDQSGIYGTKGNAASTNKPGARTSTVSWTDSSGNLLLFGGRSPYFNYTGLLNDLWKYAPSTGQWTWLSGDNDYNQSGVYGTKGTVASSNKPGARCLAFSWTDPLHNLWLFGGLSRDKYFNDLWKYSKSNVPLPVQLTGFTAHIQPHAVLLNWTTAQEQNSRYFVVERSPGGIVYDSIAQVAAAGTSSSATGYVFTDLVPLPGSSFYRLKQLDNDSRFMFSAVVKVIMNDNARFTVIQNPVQNTLQLKVQLPAAQQLNLQVSDISGRVLLSKEQNGTKGISMYSLSVNHLAKGTYVISMKTGNVNSTKTFLVQ